MYGYIYKTTNLIDGKIYIGQHKYDKEELDKKYIGSGVILNRAIKKYGIKNFKCEIIEFCPNLKILDEREIYWISYYDSIQTGYNILEGGKGTLNYHHTDQTKQIISETSKDRVWINKDSRNKFIKRSEVTKYLNEGWAIGVIKKDYDRVKRNEKIKQSRTNQICFTDGKTNHYCKPELAGDLEKQGFYIGRTKKDRKPQVWIKKETIEKKIDIEYIEQYINAGWSLGRTPKTLSKESKDKMIEKLRQYRINNPMSESKRLERNLKISQAKISSKYKIDEKTKQKISESLKTFYQTDEGKELRAKKSDKAKGRTSSNKGKKMSEKTKNLLSLKNSNKVFVNNGIIEKVLPQKEADVLLNNGWNKGHLKSNSLDTIWVNNGTVNKRIHKEEKNKFISIGWLEGRIRK